MRKWFCDGCETEFGSYSDARAKSRVEVKSPPTYEGTEKMYFCEECSESLLEAIKQAFPKIRMRE
jgi:uncharacterized protein YlaI